MTETHGDPPAVTPGPLVEVDDPDDPRLDLYRDLNDPAGRIRLVADESVFVVEGRIAVDRLLTSQYTVRSLLVDDHQVTATSDLVAATRARGAPVFVGSRALVAGTVGFALHRGVVAIANRPAPGGTARLLDDAAGRSAQGELLRSSPSSRASTTMRTSAPYSATPPPSGWRASSSTRHAPTRSTGGRSGCLLGMSSTCRSPGWCRGRPGSTRCGPPASSSPR